MAENSTIDPEKVKAALAEIDEWNRCGGFRGADEATLNHGPLLIDVARAWLQIGTLAGEAAEKLSECRDLADNAGSLEPGETYLIQDLIDELKAVSVETPR